MSKDRPWFEVTTGYLKKALRKADLASTMGAAHSGPQTFGSYSHVPVVQRHSRSRGKMTVEFLIVRDLCPASGANNRAPTSEC